MGNLTFSEIIWILVVILIVFGPQRLPEMARKVGQFIAKARVAATALQQQINDEYGEAIAPLRDVSNELKEARRTFTDTARSAARELEEDAKKLQAPPAGLSPGPAAQADSGPPEGGSTEPKPIPSPGEQQDAPSSPPVGDDDEPPDSGSAP